MSCIDKEVTVNVGKVMECVSSTYRVLTIINTMAVVGVCGGAVHAFKATSDAVWCQRNAEMYILALVSTVVFWVGKLLFQWVIYPAIRKGKSSSGIFTVEFMASYVVNSVPCLLWLLYILLSLENGCGSHLVAATALSTLHLFDMMHATAQQAFFWNFLKFIFTDPTAYCQKEKKSTTTSTAAGETKEKEE